MLYTLISSGCPVPGTRVCLDFFLKQILIFFFPQVLRLSWSTIMLVIKGNAEEIWWTGVLERFLWVRGWGWGWRIGDSRPRPKVAWPIRSPISGGSSSKRSQGPSCQGGFFFPKLTLWAVQGLSKPLQAGIPGHLLSSSRCLLFPILGVLEVIHMYFREKPQWAATEFKASLSIKPGSLMLLPSYYLLSNYQATHQNFCREMRLLFSKQTTNVVSKMTAK